MAELAPLTNAHAHARKAVDELQLVHWSQAADEHQKASAEFSRTARGTNDGEALRVLKLLEEQHQKLARIVRAYDTAEQTQSVPEESKPVDSKAAVKSTSPGSTVEANATPRSQATTSALATARAGKQVRDSSPSLARDIASRRGIPQPGRGQPSAAAQARVRQLSPESHRRSRPGATPKIPPSIVDSQSNLQHAKKTSKPDEDEGFTKFYSSLTTGTMSKLSSALAYAGLPLTVEENTPASKPEKRTVNAVNEPDVKALFSKAALEAVEDEHRQKGTLGHGFAPSESFYVVQKGGGTYSYADIARAQQHQHLSGIEEDDEDAFVDAKEVPGPPSPKHSRTSSGQLQTQQQQQQQQQQRSAFGNPRTQEELELENSTLKQTLVEMAARLEAFETHAQDASMAALAQSMASLRGGGAEMGLQERLKLMERQLEQQAVDKLRLEGLVTKQKDTLQRYQSKWEEVKKSAREKDRLKKEKEKVKEKEKEKEKERGEEKAEKVASQPQEEVE